MEHRTVAEMEKQLGRNWETYYGTSGIDYTYGMTAYMAGGLLGVCVFTATCNFLRNHIAVHLDTTTGIWMSENRRVYADFVESELNLWREQLAHSGLPNALINSLTCI